MQPRLGPAVRNALAVVGGVALLAVAAAAAFVIYAVATNRPRHDRATPRDVRFVLNWPELGDDRIEAVVRSFESARGFGGDHCTVYAIRVKMLSEAELSEAGRWVRGDRADALMRERSSSQPRRVTKSHGCLRRRSC